MAQEDSNTEQVSADDSQLDSATKDAQETVSADDSHKNVADANESAAASQDAGDDHTPADTADDAQEASEDDAPQADAIQDTSEQDPSDDSTENASDEKSDVKDATDSQEAADESADAADEASDEAANDGAAADEASDEAASDDASGDESTDIKPVPTAAAALKKRALIRKAMIALAAAILIVIAGCCVALAIDDNSRTQLVPEKTTLDGQVDVSNMTEDELRNLVVSRADEGLSTVVSLDIDGAVYSIDLREVGTLAPQDTVAQAYAPYNQLFFMRWGARIVELATNEKGSYEIRTACAVDHNALKARVEEIAEQANHDPKDAGYAFDKESRRLVTTPPVNGVVVDVDATVAKIEAAAKSNNPLPERYQIQATATTTAPEVLESGQAILVDTSECRVRLYEAGEEVASYACTPGMSGYATPRGDWYLDYKDAAPVWINPHSDWSASMPDTIAPGASNPLGLRALAVSCGGGIYIHGTTNTGGLGYPGSHGCIRLSNSNIVELYDRVSAGIPIIIR